MTELMTDLKGENNNNNNNNDSNNNLPSIDCDFEFAWRNLNVYLNDNNNGFGKQILYNISGSICSGELLCIMGESGSGKTTLLNVLSGRTNLNSIIINGGYLSINNRKFKCNKQNIMSSICTYVPQSDILCPTQTVEEALIFYAKLKLSHLSKEKQIERVNYLINALNLNKCKNNYIGDEKKRGISGGEKKRVSIAAELLIDVNMIFLDEPTSGLDAYTAAKTIKLLKKLASISNKIIIVTIHQPSIQVFYLFNKLLLLYDGKCYFNSFINNIDEYFKHCLRPKTNPADIIIFEIQKYSNKYIKKWQQQYNHDDHKEELVFDFDLNLEIKNNNIVTNGEMAPKSLQYKLLLIRELKSLWRRRRVTILQMSQIIFFAVISGIIFFDIVHGFITRSWAFFLLTLISFLFGIVSLITVFPKQILIFQREYSCKTYNISSWVIAIMMIEIMRDIIFMLTYVLITYYMMDLDGNLIEYYITYLLASISGGSFGVLFGTISKTTVESAQLIPAAIIPSVIWSDALVRISSLPSSLQWIRRINPVYYIIRCLYIIEFYGISYPRNIQQDLQKSCDQYEFVLNYYILINNNTLINYLNKTLLYMDIAQKNLTDNDIPNDIPVDIQDSNFTDNNIPNDIPVDISDNNLTDNDVINDINVDIRNELISILNINNRHYTNYTNYDQQYMNYSNITNVIEAQQGFVNKLCSKQTPFTDFAPNLHSNQLIIYWFIIIITCLILRLISILILLIKNDNKYNWFYKKIIKIFKCKHLFNNKNNQKTINTSKQTLDSIKKEEEKEESDNI